MRLTIPTIVLVIGAAVPLIASAGPQSGSQGATAKSVVVDNKMPERWEEMKRVTDHDEISNPGSTSVPEPAALSLLGAALVMLGLSRRRGANRAR